MYRIGMIGYGAIGRLHATVLQMLPQLYPQLLLRPQLAAICAGGPQSQANAHRDWPAVPQLTYADLLADPTIALVLCATPTGNHAEHVALALAAGKHVVCEKPLTVHRSQSLALWQHAQSQGLVLAMNHHFRRIPALQQARQWVADGQLGRGISAHLRYFRASNVRPDRPVTWRFSGDAGGVLVDLGSHLIDLTHYVFDQRIVRVQAQLRTVWPHRPNQQGELTTVISDDVAWLNAELADGMRVSIEASKVVPGAADDIRIEAYGDQGSFVFDMADVNTLQIGRADAPAAMQRTHQWNRQSPQPTLPGAETATGSLAWHAATWESVLAHLAGESRQVCDGSAGVAVDSVIEAARTSAARDAQWVEVAQ
jgi:predicted dehydrogenase